MISVVDLFAGPGGLGEGFSSFTIKDKPVFKIKVSIEKDELAHRTLLLRAFFRQFPRGAAPREYYQYLSKIEKTDADLKQLFNAYPTEAARAAREAVKAELGQIEDEKKINAVISRRIRVGGNWVLIGGPPCQAYSLAGRSRMSKIRKEDPALFERDVKHTLYREYLKIIAEFQPAVFVMENVKGILSSTLEGKKIFNRILEDLENPLSSVNTAGRENQGNLQYKLYPLVRKQGGFDFETNGFFEPNDFVVKAEDHGVPQARHRVFILGVRTDIARIPDELIPSSRRSVKSVISDLPRLRSRLSKEKDSDKKWNETICSVLSASWFGRNFNNIDEDFWLYLKDIVERISGSNLPAGCEFICTCKTEPFNDAWFYDPFLGGVCNHSTRGHITEDLHRYLYASAFAEHYKRSPTLKDFPEELLPRHKNVGLALQGGMFTDRFKVQLAERPATTVTSHISKDGHYFIHHDPTQCRSLTVREAARLQTFPDNYFFEGPRTSQYQQVGNAVPPLLAKQIAEIVLDLVRENPKV
ncbi:MAG: DNA cytosine methyltransferase [Acidobacteriota bacterium]|nr:DNA cytosine methyltransferase [Acidobacteriota bacterium]